jgi:hypothetical protein
MRYFKPELLARCRSLDDDVADVADAEWEKAIADYRERIQSIRPRLPRSVRSLLTHFSLHDAKVLAIAFGKKPPTFALLIRLEDTPSKPGELLELSYLPVAGPGGGVTFHKHPQINEHSSGQGWILYDEFDLMEEKSFFTHSLLLSDGMEAIVRFHGLRVAQLEEALTTPQQLNESERTWPLVGA